MLLKGPTLRVLLYFPTVVGASVDSLSTAYSVTGVMSRVTFSIDVSQTRDKS